jgi:peptidoglycan-N-acetylglucosamine deacetylase
MSSGVTVCLTVDYDAVSVWRMHGTVGARGLSRGEFGVTEGAPRLLDSLMRHGVTATWFVPGITARQYPESVAGVARAGHEIANHGYFHDDFAVLSPDEARSAIRRGTETLLEITGQRLC